MTYDNKLYNLFVSGATTHWDLPYNKFVDAVPRGGVGTELSVCGGTAWCCNDASFSPAVFWQH